MRIAMWSGPRNLSTAMMYSFAQRADCAVVDEPFYAAYLAATGLDHPMRDAVLASQPTDAGAVVETLAMPSETPLQYEKHMVHHIQPDWPTDWFGDVTHVFLIRHPARVIASYDVKRENPTLDDLGFRHQFELYQRVSEMGLDSVVIDSRDIRNDPAAMLALLCDRTGIEFDPAMLTWPAGGNEADGVWASHWYGAVHRSTGFAGAEGPLPEIGDALAPLLHTALPFYEELAAQRLSPV